MTPTQQFHLEGGRETGQGGKEWELRRQCELCRPPRAGHRVGTELPSSQREEGLMGSVRYQQRED